MQYTVLRFGDRQLALDVDQDVPQLKREVVAAARKGGGVVECGLGGGRRVDILVTTAVPILFETVEAPFVEQLDEPEGARYFDDWELLA